LLVADEGMGKRNASIRRVKRRFLIRRDHGVSLALVG
jgi:hypothetical protein